MVLALVATLIFSYISFLGMLYHDMSNSNTPILNAIALIGIVSLCCFGMCYGKAERNKYLGKSVQFILGGVIFVVLILGAIPFTNFLDVLSKSDEIDEKVEEVFNYASNLDNNYAEYANSRIRDYEYVLSPVAEEPIGTFITAPQNFAIDYETLIKSQALRRLILPESRKPIIERRQQWLNECREMSLWNIATPENLRNLNFIVSSWIDEYRALSSKGFEDESFDPFVKEDFTSSIDTLMDEFKTYQFPSIIAVLITILVFGIILLPYILTGTWEFGNDSMNSKRDGSPKEFKWI